MCIHTPKKGMKQLLWTSNCVRSVGGYFIFNSSIIVMSTLNCAENLEQLHYLHADKSKSLGLRYSNKETQGLCSCVHTTCIEAVFFARRAQVVWAHKAPSGFVCPDNLLSGRQRFESTVLQHNQPCAFRICSCSVFFLL